MAGVSVRSRMNSSMKIGVCRLAGVRSAAEAKADEAWASRSTCVVAQGWRMAMQANPEVEVVREQHGLL